MENSTPWFFWLFPLTFAVHNIEEALFLPAWSKSAGRFHKPVGVFEFVFTLVVLTTASVIITVLAGSAGKQTLPSYLYFAFNFGMLVNVLYPHLTATIVLKKYCPGLSTGMLFLVPTTGYLLFYRFDHHCVLFPMFWFITVPFAALVVGSIPVLFKIGRSLHGALKTSTIGQ
jgi:hypothetical protein